MEYVAAKDSGVVVIAKNEGTVEYVDTTKIEIRRSDGQVLMNINCLNLSALIKGLVLIRNLSSVKMDIEKVRVIADGPSEKWRDCTW